MTRRRRGVLAAVLLVALPSTTAAHSLLLEASPAPNAVVDAPPAVSLRFNNRVERRLSRVRLVDEAGRERAVVVADEGPADRLRAPLPSLSPGAYRVEWQVLSTDGHVVSGSYDFRVR